MVEGHAQWKQQFWLYHAYPDGWSVEQNKVYIHAILRFQTKRKEMCEHRLKSTGLRSPETHQKKFGSVIRQAGSEQKCLVGGSLRLSRDRLPAKTLALEGVRQSVFYYIENVDSLFMESLVIGKPLKLHSKSGLNCIRYSHFLPISTFCSPLYHNLANKIMALEKVVAFELTKIGGSWTDKYTLIWLEQLKF